MQNGPIAKSGALPVTTLFFWKFYFSLRTSYKEVIGCTNDPNAHICTFCKRWSFIWRCFFPVSILKQILLLLSSQVFKGFNRLISKYLQLTRFPELLFVFGMKWLNSLNKCDNFLGGFKTRQFPLESVLLKNWSLTESRVVIIWLCKKGANYGST